MSQAYLQSKCELSRHIYIQPKPQGLQLFDLKPDELLELVKPLYGICEAGDYWGITMEEQLVNDLNMKPTPGDPALYVKVKGGKVIGITGSYLCNSLNGGNADFIQEADATLKKFECKASICDSSDFYGAQIETVGKTIFNLSQHYYIKKLSSLNIKASFVSELFSHVWSSRAVILRALRTKLHKLLRKTSAPRVLGRLITLFLRYKVSRIWF